MRISDWSSDVCSSDLIANYAANTLLSIEEFYNAFSFTDDLRGHSAPAASASAASGTDAKTTTITAKTATTAITETAAEASTITKAAAKTAATLFRITAIIFVAEIIPLILAAPAAASSIKTHALLVTFASSQFDRDCLTDESHTIPAAKNMQLGFVIADFHPLRELFYLSAMQIPRIMTSQS